MSVKALQKQLIAAVAMVLVAAIAVSSSTFAWFAANTTVTASGMQVTAQSDAVFLKIKGTGGTVGEGTITGSASDFATSSSVAMTNVKLFPSDHEAFSAIADIGAADSTVVTDMDKWFYRYSDDPAVYNSNMTTATPVTVANFNKYVAEVTYQVKLDDASGADTAYDLYVKNITIAANSGINAIVVGADGYQEFTATVADNTAGAVVLSNTVTKTAQTVTVYLFINGNDSNVYTNNINNLTGAVTMDLGCYVEDTLGVTP